MAPHARMAFSCGDGGFEEEVGRISGVKNKRGAWTVPFNAIRVVDAVARRFNAKVLSASWGHKPDVSVSWTQVKEKLVEGGEVRDWVLDGFLTHYQEEAVAFGWTSTGINYWHPTGSGKTLTGILCSLCIEGPVVVVTRAASRIQFSREIERFLNVRAYVLRPLSLHKKVTVKGESWHAFRSRHKGQGFSTKEMGEMWKKHQEVHGVDPPKGLQDYLDTIDHRAFVVVAWEALRDNIEALVALHPSTVIFDESHRGKNSKRWDVIHLPELPDDQSDALKAAAEEEAQASRVGGFIKDTEDGRKMFVPVINTAAAAARLARASRKRICTTATPIKDRVRDLWAQLDLSEPNAWGNATAFFTRYCDRKPGIYGGFDTRGSSNLEELNLRLKRVSHILDYRDTHRELPAKRRQSIYILPEDQNQAAAGFPGELREAQKRGASAVLEVRLAQAASKKRKAVLGMIEDHISSGQKVTVFTGRRRDCDELGKRIRGSSIVKGKGASVWCAHGAQTTDHRQDIVDAYMEDEGPCVLVGTGHAFGESLNLHDTDAVFFVMLPYTPGQLRQWEGRFTRLGQKRPVVIYYVIAEGTYEKE
jgi:superfamily II DNA or RNA helicase